MSSNITENFKGYKLLANHPLISWLVKHAAYLINRYLVHQDGTISFERRWGRPGNGNPVLYFGEKVLYKLQTSDGHRIPKGELQFREGLWLCRDTESPEHFLFDLESRKAMKARTLRRLPAEQHFDSDNFKNFRAVPWNPKSTGVIESFILPPEAIRSGRSVGGGETGETSQTQKREMPLKLL